MATEHTLEDVRQYLKRTISVERVVLLVKLAVIAFAFSVVIIGVGPLGTSDDTAISGADGGTGSDSGPTHFRSTVVYFKLQLALYTVGNCIFWFCLFVVGRRISRYLFIKTTAFFLVIIDIIFVSLLIWLLPDLQSSLFWLYCFVLIHAVLLFPDALTLGALTAVSIAFYVGAASWSMEQPLSEADLSPHQRGDIEEKLE